MVKKSFSLSIFKRRISPHLPLLRKTLLALFLGASLTLFIRSLPSIGKLISHLFSSKSTTAASLIRNPQSVLKSSQGRTNLLILGKGGAGHEAPDLTDTIIFMSYQHQTKQALMISLPRDIWVQSLQAKLNAAYYYGNQKQPGGGLILSRAAVEEIIDQPIHYSLVIDFSSFTRIVDLVGGVDIDIPESFDDYKYPIPGKESVFPEADRYQHLRFTAGPQTMDGARALKYVRSRNAEGDQGTDYARTLRQQQVIMALKSRLLSRKTLLNYQILKQFLAIANTAIETDLSTADVLAFAKLALSFDDQKLTSLVLDDDWLFNPPISSQYQNQWVLTGKDGSWKEVQAYVAELLKE